MSTLDKAKSLILAGHLGEATTFLQSYLQQNPRDGTAWFYNGHLLALLKRNHEAVHSFKIAFSLAPENPDVCMDLGAALILDDRPLEGEPFLRDAMRINPKNLRPALNLAKMLCGLARYTDAEIEYRAILSANCNEAEATLGLSGLLVDLKRSEEAIEILQFFLQDNPKHLSALSLLGLALDQIGKLDEALSVIQRTIEIEPPQQLNMTLASYVSLVGRLARFDLREHVLELVKKAISITLPDANRARWLEVDASALKRFSFLLPYYGVSDREQLKVRRALGATIASRYPSKAAVASTVCERLRIGFICYNFGNHPIGHLLSGFFEAHGHERTELFIYSLSVSGNDVSEYRARIFRAADHFRDCHEKSDGELEAIIRADTLHILIDLDGYLYGGRPEVLSRRPACIQIHWLQSLAGMPAPFIDYTIVDKIIVPDGERNQGNGSLIRLADAFQCGEKLELPKTLPSRKSQSLPLEGFVFCAFGNWLKIDGEVFSCWMEILLNVPDSVLWLSAGPTPQAIDQLRKNAALGGVDPRRLIMAPRIEPKTEHLSRQQLAELYLDTFTFSAATTATDALSVGVPVLTKIGDTAQSRISESLIRATGLHDLIVGNKEEYVKQAIRLAKNRKELKMLREAQTKALETAPLFDAKRMVRQFETIYPEVWRLYMQGRKPQHIDIVVKD